MNEVRLPRMQPGQAMGDYLERLIAEIERALSKAPVGGSYKVVGAPLRQLDTATATPEQTAQVLVTLVSDLRRGSILT